MASSGRVMDSPVKAALETQSSPDAEAAPAYLVRADFALRLMLLSASVASLGIVVSSHQTKAVGAPPFAIYVKAKFTYSSAVIYHVAATSVVCLYGILSAAASFFILPRASPRAARLLLLLAFLDAAMAAVLASSLGAVSSIAYVGLKGNSHVGWGKVCNVFDKFCWHAAGSGILSLGASMVLLLLVLISTYSLYRRGRC